MKKMHYLLSIVFFTLLSVSCSKDEAKKSSLNTISEFTIDFNGVDPSSVKKEVSGDNITFTVPYKTPLNDLKPTIIIPKAASISPASGEAVTFKVGEAKEYIVTAEDGSKKSYRVIINYAPEVGSGTRLKKTTEFCTDFGIEVIYEYTYNKDNLVSSYTVTDSGIKKTYQLEYNSQNQIVAKKETTKGNNTTYTYNDEGQIISSKEVDKDGVAVYTHTYSYGSEGYLDKIESIDSKNKTSVQTFKYEKGNAIKYTTGTETYVAEFDTKNNPLIGIYPTAYGRIVAGNNGFSVNKNNPIKRTGADEGITYQYNSDGYPVSATYTVYGSITFNNSYEYYQ